MLKRSCASVGARLGCLPVLLSRLASRSRRRACRPASAAKCTRAASVEPSGAAGSGRQESEGQRPLLGGMTFCRLCARTLHMEPSVAWEPF